MRKTVSIVLVLLMTLSVASIVCAEDYLLGPGDVLDIRVLDFDELQVKDLIVRNDGKIAFPIVGEIRASGLSPGQLTNIITAGISHYAREPKVTVNVIKYRTTRIYVLGEVARPGMYELEKQHLLLDAIGAAGGYTKDALKKKAYIIRKNSHSQPESVNLIKLLRQGDMTQNCVLNDGDVVYFAASGRIDFNRDILPFFSIAYQIKELND
ncbi:Polysialic acid transport protein KpsD precursor [Sporomusa ovata DSM 2662]|uniref:Capsule polysaccharide export protein n=1 Tax=Sporomusa ovata TaxID=2378 RepID=A0A0U1L4T9_9FIRM|nr:polysaccharide biosynthesis/export family protein [Sporomusa ovata]EQB28383.1 polysaccharide export protein [Sporomusa ovata DSM 2662]CQR74708.1 Capsule polysaccharide export protein [Sporomusa ovata]